MLIRFLDGPLQGRVEQYGGSVLPCMLTRSKNGTCGGYRYVYERISSDEFRYHRREFCSAKGQRKAVPR